MIRWVFVPMVVIIAACWLIIVVTLVVALQSLGRQIREKRSQGRDER